MHTRMNPRVKHLWTADLLTNPPQIKGRLSTDYGDCCLGRLCKIAVAEGILPPPTLSDDHDHVDVDGNPVYVYAHDEGTDSGIAVLPRAVCEWAGLWQTGSTWGEKTPNTAGYFVVSSGTGSLASLNDAGTPMAEIAQVIEELF